MDADVIPHQHDRATELDTGPALNHSLTRNTAAISRFFPPQPKRWTAPSRIRSHVALPALVSLLPCAYLAP